MLQFRALPIGIEGFAVQQGIEAKVLDPGRNADHVMALTGWQQETDQESQGIDQGEHRAQTKDG